MLAGGAIAAGAIVLVALVLIPFARRWDDRREAIQANRDRVQRYAVLLQSEKALRAEVAARRRSRRRTSSRCSRTTRGPAA